MSLEHSPVLLNEVLEGLNIKASGTYIDLTFGRGGHSAEILRRLGPNGHLLALDRDPAAMVAAKQTALYEDARFSLEHARFSQLKTLVEQRVELAKVDGILMDLGVSSPQLDQAQRGFSFMRTGPLDMRMDPSSGMDAASWLNQAEQEEISLVIRDYGQERYHWRIAKAIVEYRQSKSLTTTTELADLVAKVCPTHEQRKHPATRVFQAIRIHINGELEELKQVLGQALDVLKMGGRLCVISFHSLEDRIVKRFIRDQAQADPYPSYLPVKAVEIKHRLKKVGSLIRPSQLEIEQNPRARSSRLRVAEKIA